MSARLKCAVCGRSWADSVAFRCYRKPEKTVCMYCCVTRCGNGYRADGGVRCRAFDKAREAEKKKAEKEVV